VNLRFGLTVHGTGTSSQHSKQQCSIHHVVLQQELTRKIWKILLLHDTIKQN